MGTSPSPADLVSSFFAALDRLDAEGVVGFMADDAAAVDETTRGWARGRAAVAASTAAVLCRWRSIVHTVRAGKTGAGNAGEFTSCVLLPIAILQYSSSYCNSYCNSIAY